MNHKNFKTQKEALAFLKEHALMSVGWPYKKGCKEACYWKGQVYITTWDSLPLRNEHGQ